MKFSCLQENLKKGLNTVIRAVATRATFPITNNVFISTDESRLKLTAYNLEMAITCWIGAKVEEEGAITVPARLLTDFVNTLPNERLDISLLPQSKTMEIHCARFQARISGIDAGDFPSIPTVENRIPISVEPDALRQAVTQVVFAAAKEDSRPVLTGIDVVFDGSQLTLAAADGFRLAVYKLPLVNAVTEKTEAIIPSKTLAELNRLMADRKEAVQVLVNPNKGQALFRLDNVELVSQLALGTFPNYNQLIPAQYKSRVIVDRKQLLRSVRIASIVTDIKSSIVRLVAVPVAELTPGKLVVSARSEEVGNNVGEVDAEIDGEEAKIAFDPKYLIDVLSVLREEKVALETTSPSSPGVIRPVGSDNYTYVIMPMFTQW